MRERNTMSNEVSRIRRIVDRLKHPEDLAELVRMAKSEIAAGLAFRDLDRFDRGVAIRDVASEALGNARVRGQLPRYTQAA